MNLYDKSSLILVPGAVKDGKVYSQRPENGDGDFTFTRGSNLAATRVDENGLIEKGRENLLLQSNQFDTTWSVINASVTSGQSGYDGNDAWLFSKSGSVGRVEQTISYTGIHTFSVYAKQGTAEGIRVRIDNGGYYVDFDLVNGLVVNLVSVPEEFATITSVGNGYYRCSVTASVSVGTIVRIYPATITGDVTQTSGSIYIQDAQLEFGLVATDYIETTTTTAQAGILEDMPRLDYSGGASCPSLLLEPTRTNLVPYSEGYVGFQTSISGTGVTPVVTQNAAISPDGTQNAFRVDLDRGAGNTSGDFSWIYQGSVVYAGENQVSVYLKAATSSDIGKEVSLRASGSSQALTLTADWKRHTMSITLSTTSDVGLYSRGGQNVDNAVSCFVYGFQVENNSSYPSSYIPTYGSAVTRSYEVYEKTSATSLIGQTQGVLFVDFVPNSESNLQWIAFLGSGNKYIGIYVNSGKVLFEVTNVTGQAVFLAPTTIVKGQRYKCAIAYAENDFAAYINGVQINTDSSGSVPATSTIRSYYNSIINGIKTNQLLVYKTRLTNGELAALTTL